MFLSYIISQLRMLNYKNAFFNYLQLQNQNIMFKESTFKIVPNKFINDDQFDYVLPAKIKSKVSQKITEKLPFNDATNRLSSMQNSQLPKNLQIVGYEPLQEIEIVPEVVSVKKIVRKQNVCKNFTEQIKCEKQIQRIVHENVKKIEIVANPKLEDIIKPKLGERKRIFNLNLSDDSQNSEEIEKSSKKVDEQGCDLININAIDENIKLDEDVKVKESEQNNKCTVIFDKMHEKRKKVTKFEIQLTDSSSQEEVTCQLEPKQDIKPFLESQQPTKRDKKFILNTFDSDSDSEINGIKFNKQLSEDQQCFQIVRNLNIRKLRQHFSYINNDQNFQCFSPIPPEAKTSLIIKRNLSNSQYIIYDSELVCQILKVTKNIGGTYKFMIPKTSKTQPLHIATMKSNFIGTEFHCYAKKENKDEKYQSISITYEMNILGFNGPRKIKMHSVVNPIPTSNNILQIYTKNSCKNQIAINTYESKTPKWDAQIGSFILNLRGTASLSSIKNCIMVDTETKKNEHLIFGKKAKDIFNLQVKHPLTILQGVAFAVSSFERKLACE